MKTARVFIKFIGALLFLALAVFPPGTGKAEPRRIVSMNVCADQFLLMLADHDNIASLSIFAADEKMSAMAKEAAGFPVNHGFAEEILRIEPDLILAGEHTAQPTVSLLRKLGYPVVELPLALNLDDIRTNIRTVAKAVGNINRGEDLIAEFDKNLSPIEKAPVGPSSPVAAFYWANGYSSGEGTLAAAVVKAAGFRNMASELGIRGTAKIPLETLVTANPDIIITDIESRMPALAMEVFRHPALKTVFDDRKHIRIPSYLWVCGMPVIADVVNDLYALRLELQRLAARHDGEAEE